MRRCIAMGLCLMLLCGCTPRTEIVTGMESASPNGIAGDPTPSASASLPPISTPQPTSNSVLPIQDTGVSLYSWDGYVPELPAMEHWSFNFSTLWPKDYDAEGLLSRLWKGQKYESKTSDGVFSAVLPRSAHGKFRENFYIVYDGSGSSQVSCRWDNNEHAPEQSDMKISYEQAMTEGKAFFDGLFETDAYTTNPLPQENLYDLDTGDIIEPPPAYSLRWAQIHNGLRLHGFGLSANRINEGINQFTLKWASLTPTEEPVPMNPLTFEQALYAMNYHRAKWGDGKSNVFTYGDTIANVEIVYVVAFGKDGDTLRPAWRFTLYSSTRDAKVDLDYYVDMVSGELWNGDKQGGWRPSPFLDRPHSEVWIETSD